MHSRKTGGWIPKYALIAVPRSEILENREGNLRDSADAEVAVGAVERAVQHFIARREAGINERPQVEVVPHELRGLRNAAEGMTDEVAALSGETWARLRAWVPETPSTSTDCAPRRPVLPSDVLRSAADLCSQIADRTEFLQRDLEAEKPQRGRPPDLAARALAYELSLVWRRFADAPMTRPRGTTPSPWFEFVKIVLRIAGADAKGEGYARELVDHWRIVEEKHSDSGL